MKLIFTFILSALCTFTFQAQQNSAPLPLTKALFFKENKGQISDQNYVPRTDVLFSASVGELVFHLKKDGISYQLNRVEEWVKNNNHHLRTLSDEKLIPGKTTVYRVDVKWLNANSTAELVKGQAQPGVNNYYLESCPAGAIGVRSYSELLYKNVYPGIDVKWYQKNGALEYDFQIAAHADYNTIQLQYEGAESISIDKNGSLLIKTPLGIIKEQKPMVVQDNKTLEANWIVKNNIVSFQVKHLNPALPFVIDPVVRLWGSYFGGSDFDDAYYSHANASGELYISGGTLSLANIATTGAHQITFGGGGTRGDGYLAKFSPGGALLWATYYGGAGSDFACESIEDSNGNVFLTGGTSSSLTGVISTPGAHQVAYSTASTNTGDAFLVKFNSSGVRLWGTYYGGDLLDEGDGLSMDNSGNIFLFGTTGSSNNISTPGSQQAAIATGADCFLVKFNAGGVRQWATYYGGNSPNDKAADCITDSNGDTYVCGATSSTIGISTPGCHQATYGGGPAVAGEAFLAKYDASGVLQWGTYYGGTGSDYISNLAIDPAGDLYGAGWTSSATGTVIATASSHQPTFGGLQDGFLVKFNAGGVRQWATYYGGTGPDFGGGVAIDASGNVYLSGDGGTTSGTNIATPCAYQSNLGGGGNDAFLAKFTNTGRRIWGTYYGGNYTDYCYACAADGLGNIYLIGITNGNATNNPLGTAGAYQMNYGGGNSDAFIAKFDGCIGGSPVITTPSANLLVCSGKSATLSATCGDWYSSATATNVLGTGATYVSTSLTANTTFYVEDFGCGFISGPRTPVTVTILSVPSLSLSNNFPGACVGETVTLNASGATNYTWSGTGATSSSIQVIVLLATTFTVTGSDSKGCSASSTIAIEPNLCNGIIENTSDKKTITVLPNPSTGSFEIHGHSSANLQLFDQLGQSVRSINLSAANNYHAQITELSPGVYYLQNENVGPVSNQKIVVIR